MPDHRTGTREEWLTAGSSRPGRKGLHPSGRRAREQRQELPGSGSRRTPLRDRRGQRLARGSLPRPLQLLMSTSCSGRLHGRVPGVLHDRRRLRRLRRPPREPRRRDDGRVAGAARGPPGVQAPHGLDVPCASSFGSDFNFDFTLVHGGAQRATRSNTTTSDGHDADPRTAQRGADGDRRDDGDRRRGYTCEGPEWRFRARGRGR